MLHQISPFLFRNEFEPNVSIKSNDYIFCFSGSKLLIKRNVDRYILPRFLELEQHIDVNKLVYGFSLDEVKCFLYLDDLSDLVSPFIFEEVYPIRFSDQKEIAWVSSVSMQMKTWYSENRFCGKCGSSTHVLTNERAIRCTKCNHTIYPKISPAIIVAVISGNNILLGRGVNFRSKFYSLIAGYADVGESLEDAVKREVKEEVGIDIYNIRYYSSQPWPYSGSMMIGYIAEADEKQPIIIDEHEISDAGWFSKDDLPEYPKEISIAGEMIEKFKIGRL